jgi:glutamate formiminotransferase
MTLLAVPNVSEGRDPTRIAHLVGVTEARGARVLDIHSDASHHRSVLTLTAPVEELINACTALAVAASAIDLRTHHGVHPRLGGLDVCPIVPHQADMKEAVEAARSLAQRIGSESALPVYLYGNAASRDASRELPDLRRGGLATLAVRARRDLPPDAGPQEVDPARGVVCVGARGPLIAFNVWLDADIDVTRELARQVRSPAVRALGLAVEGATQVSMNLVQPVTVGIEEAFEGVRSGADVLGARVTATEIVGLVERRFLPPPDATVTRLLLEPGHCLEERLKRLG